MGNALCYSNGEWQLRWNMLHSCCSNRQLTGDALEQHSFNKRKISFPHTHTTVQLPAFERLLALGKLRRRTLYHSLSYCRLPLAILLTFTQCCVRRKPIRSSNFESATSREGIALSPAAKIERIKGQLTCVTLVPPKKIGPVA